jgi:DivIVA domain-containing protein
MMLNPARSTDSVRFRLRWRGYDRAEVDEFLRQTQADRQRLQEDLAQLEAVMAGHGDERRRELERLSVLRIEVAGCLEQSISALRAATEQLSAVPPTAPPTPAPRVARATAKPAAAWVSFRPAWLNLRGLTWGAPLSGLPRPSMSAGRTRAMIAAGSAAVLILALVTYQNQPRASEMPEVDVAEAAREIPGPVPSLALSEPPAPAIPQVEGLVLTLTARGPCWIGTTIDGGQRLERELKPEETIMLRADQEVLLRVGDAAALSMLINNVPAKPLGAAGQVVSVRITRDNYFSLLSDQ